MRYDVCIIGGGAAGLAAAASFNEDMKICILEKNNEPGRKTLATGGGKCNLTNEACENRSPVLNMFRKLGIETRKDAEGRYYPYSNKASDVADALIGALGNNVDIICSFAVDTIEQTGTSCRPEYTVRGCGAEGVENTFRATFVLISTGGKAAPQFGTTGDGYALARSLGHSLTRVYPILTGVECEREGVDFQKLKGIRAPGRATLLKKGQHVHEETGEIQFTEDGLSGICIFNLTPYIRADEGENPRDAMRNFEISLDLAADFDREYLKGRDSSFGILTRKLAEAVSIENIKDWRLKVTGVKGWRHAQATCGGVPINEINMETMESRMVPGLFFAGEILDIQGPCGGFNLQNAWETGMKAAAAIEKGMK